MTFTSLTFLLFLSSALVLYTAVPARVRWLLLLTASYFFYAWLNIPYLLLTLGAVTIVSYIGGILINRTESSRAKRNWLLVGIAVNLSFLVWLRYLPFIAENLNLILSWTVPAQQIVAIAPLVAVGVSYYVFQGISYLIDIYLEILEPERHPGIFALSMSFFPKLLQGPIERGGNLLPQLRILSAPAWENLRTGANLFIWGMFKKVVIADRLATFVDPVYANVTNYYGLSLLVATYLFAFQLYFDFSGYTDMALGAARCFNIKLTQNFNSPYKATSIAEFWRRWHISFSGWILDYIFKPLQLRLRNWPRWGTPLALVVTFLISGIWHGASWCFVAWGLIHGVYLGCDVLSRQWKKKLCKSLGWDKSKWLTAWQIFVTFHLVCFSWIFFRAASIKDALYVSRSALTDIPRSLSLLGAGEWLAIDHIVLGRSPWELLGIIALITLTATMARVGRRIEGDWSQPAEVSWLPRLPFWAKGTVYGVFFYLIAFCGASTQSFIYLQF